MSIIVFHYKKLEISLLEIVKKPFPSTYPLTLLCMKWVQRDPNIIYLTISFTRINARKFRLYVFLILILEKMWCYDFILSGLISQEIVNLVPTYFGSSGSQNWSKIHNFLWIGLLQAKLWHHMFTRMNMRIIHEISSVRCLFLIKHTNVLN